MTIRTALCDLLGREIVMGSIGGQMEGLDINKSCFAIGQGAGAIREVLPAKEIVERTMREAEEAIGRLKKYA